MSRPPGTYSYHDDEFNNAVFSITNYIQNVESGWADEDGEDLSAAAADLAELLLRDRSEGASADETYRAIDGRGVTVPSELKELANTYLY